MTLLKFISFLILSICCLTSCNSQTANQTNKQSTDAADYLKLQAYRQKLWDSLPKPTGWTNDFEGLFSNDEKQKLDSIISAFEKETTTQICIITLDTIYTSQEKFDDFALHISNTWGVGYKDKGVSICISKGYRQMRINNGLAIEKILSDEETGSVIDKYFIPKFKEGKYFQGTLDGLIALISILRQKLKQKKYLDPKDANIPVPKTIFNNPKD